MTVAVCLLAYSLLVLAIGPRLLRRSTATGHAPRAGILAWQAASWSVIGSWVLAGLTMTTTATVPTQGPGGLFHACLTVVREAVSPPTVPGCALRGPPSRSGWRPARSGV
ncbi:MAG: hypothetical protein ACR2F6_05925 [Mycobacteriales bacterium]